MDYQTLQTVIEDLDRVLSLRGVSELRAKYEAMAEAVEADMAREFGQDIDWENEEVKDLFETWTTARMVELVYTTDLKSVAARLSGSSPDASTKASLAQLVRAPDS